MNVNISRDADGDAITITVTKETGIQEISVKSCHDLENIKKAIERYLRSMERETIRKARRTLDLD